jgi:hypothetical protein
MRQLQLPIYVQVCKSPNLYNSSEEVKDQSLFAIEEAEAEEMVEEV